LENIKDRPFTITYNCKSSKPPINSKVFFSKETRTYKLIVQKKDDSKKTIEATNLIDMISEVRQFLNLKHLPLPSPYLKYLDSGEVGDLDMRNYANDPETEIPNSKKTNKNSD